MKSKPACPICKVHTTRREVRAAPQMDSLVAIFVSMGSAAGLDTMPSQPPTGDSVQAPTAFKSRSVLMNITNCPKALHIPSEMNASDYTFKGAIPAKKRIQVPRPCSLQKEFEVDRDETQSTLQLDVHTDGCKLTAVDDTSKPSSRKKSQSKRKGFPNELDASRLNPSGSKMNKRVKRHGISAEQSCSKHAESEVLNEAKKAFEEGLPHEQASLNRRKLKKRKEKDIVPSSHRAEKDSDLPVGDDCSRKRLDPFFWLRDESSQEKDAVRVTQLTQTQSTVRPNFSDLKDSDGEIGFDVSKEIGNSTAICEPGSYDSDDFDWTQHPSSPELRCSPSKNQENTKDLVIDIPLEASHPSPKELSLDVMNACKRPQDILAEALPENASKESLTAQKILEVPLRKDKKRRKSGRTTSYEKTKKSVDDFARNFQTLSTNLEEQISKAGCSIREPQSKLPVCEITPSVKTAKIQLKASEKKNAEKPNKLGNKILQENNFATCSTKPTSADNQPCKKLSGSSKRDKCKPGKLSKRKHDPESIPGSANNDSISPKAEISKDSVKPSLPRCVFCGESKRSQITGSMMNFNEQGIPLAEPAQDEKIVHVHKHCAEWAPDVYFVKDEARNLSAEVARGLKMKCFSCGKRGAALGCCLKRCRRSYHYLCARALPCRWEEERFIMLCPEHKGEKFPVKKNGQRRASAKATQKSHSNTPNKLLNQAEPSTVEEAPVKWINNQSSKWVLCGSALDAAEKNQLAMCAKITGATISKAWSSNVTHVIAGTDPHGAARRTMKFLMAILEGKWVVKMAWLAACIEAGKPVSEEPFEIKTDIHGAMEGPKKGRQRVAGEGPKLFGKLQFYFMPDFLSSYKGDLQALVVAGGGGVLHRKPVALLADDDAEQRKTLIVYNGETSSSDKKADRGRMLSKRQGEAQELAFYVVANVVPHQWILDSIGASKMQPLK